MCFSFVLLWLVVMFVVVGCGVVIVVCVLFIISAVDAIDDDPNCDTRCVRGVVKWPDSRMTARPARGRRRRNPRGRKRSEVVCFMCSFGRRHHHATLAGQLPLNARSHAPWLQPPPDKRWAILGRGFLASSCLGHCWTMLRSFLGHL